MEFGLLSTSAALRRSFRALPRSDSVTTDVFHLSYSVWRIPPRYVQCNVCVLTNQK